MNVLHKNDVRDTACHEFSDCNPYFSSISSWLRHLYGVKHVEIPKENAKCVVFVSIGSLKVFIFLWNLGCNGCHGCSKREDKKTGKRGLPEEESSSKNLTEITEPIGRIEL
jgi:hypothetical protein